MTGLVLILCMVALAILLPVSLRRLRTRLDDQLVALRALRSAVGDLRRVPQALEALLSRPLPPPMPSEPPSEPLFIGAFLPTDAHAADLERQVSEAEDHAIAAAGPIRYSPTPSGGSVTRYARAPFKPAARRSGSA